MDPIVCNVCSSRIIKVEVFEDLPLTYYCPVCNQFFFPFSPDEEFFLGRKNMQSSLPPLDIGEHVYVCNINSQFSLMVGVIVKKDFKHYRVKLIDKGKHGGELLWFYEDQIKLLPEFLRSRVYKYPWIRCV